MSDKINVNGVVHDASAAVIPAMDHGFLFGDSVYETFRSYGGAFFRLADHLTRLEHSAEALELKLPLSREEFERRCRQTMEAAGEPNAAVRLVVTRGVGPMDLDPTTCCSPNVLVYARPRPVFPPERYEEGVSAAIVSRARNSRRSLDPNVKSGNYLNNVLALVEARRSGAFESIMLNAEGQVTEGSTSNLFIVKDNQVKTAPLRSGLLSGITRKVVIELCLAEGLPAEEEEFGAEELHAADEAFLTSSLKQVLPVTRLDGHPVGDGRPGPASRRLLAAYRAAVEAETGVPTARS